MTATPTAFLGGRLTLLQPNDGYRAGTDPVLLAAACPAHPRDTLLDLGCGVGTAALCVATRVPGVTLTGVERDTATAQLAQRNADASGHPMQVHCADIADLPRDLRSQQFTHVICNPPYYPPGAGSPAQNPAREAALREDTPLPIWCQTAAGRVAPRGTLTMIFRADRLPVVLAALPTSIGSLRLLPLAARADRSAKRVILQGINGGRAPFTLLAPLILHSGKAHAADGDDHSPTASAILRHAAALALK